jgi:stage V sporulation protein R
MNEGWATFWHHRILNDMYDADQIDEGVLLECMHSHTNVISQRGFAQFNPYALGFAMFTDIRRVCEHPTAEDRHYLPAVAGTDWLETLHDAMHNYRDESFILQFLSPKVLRDFKLMHIHTDETDDAWEVMQTASVEGFEAIRRELAANHRMELYLPEISVVRYRREQDRSLLLRHQAWHGKMLEAEQAEKTLAQLKYLWGYDVSMETVDAQGRVLRSLAAR